MKKISIISGVVILSVGISFAKPVYQAVQTQAQAKTDKKPATATDKTAKKAETKKEVKKVPVRKNVAKKDQAVKANTNTAK